MQEKYCFIVPTNLEAATCVLLFKWLTGKSNTTVLLSTESNIGNDLKKLNFDDFKFVYVLGFYSLENISSEFDSKKFIYVNKKINTGKFNNARIISGETTTVDLFYNFLSKYSENKLTSNQHVFYNSISKYFNYNFDSDLLPLKLFYFFKTQQSLNKVESFIKRFETGLIMFSESENSTLNIIIKDLSNSLKTLKIYKGEINYKNIKYNVSSCFGTKYVNEISHRVQKLSKSDISIVINLEKNTVHYRRSKESNLNLGDLVKEMFGGFGTEFAAFSNLNSKILEVTKTFFPVT